MESLVLLLFLFAGAFAFIAASSIWRGFVLTKLWAWFIVPIFHLPVLTIAPAIGISLIISFLTRIDTSELKKEDEDEDEWKSFAKTVAKVIFNPLITLFVGWIITQFM